MKRHSKIAFIATILFLLSACADLQKSLYVPKHEIGQIFRDAIVIGRNNAAVPLPPGEWRLVGQKQVYPFNKGRINRVVLAQTDDDTNKLSKLISVNLQWNSQGGYGWLTNSNCYLGEDDKWQLHLEKITNADGDAGWIDCWKIDTWAMKRWSKWPDDDSWNQSFDYYKKNGIDTGNVATIVHFRRTTPRQSLRVSYGFNPQVDGDLTYSQNRHWEKHRYARDEKRVDYIEGKKEWAERWRPKVADGILGKLQTSPASPKIAERLARLQQLLDDGAISVDEYNAKKREILDEL